MHSCRLIYGCEPPALPNALITVLELAASREGTLGKMAQDELLGCKSCATSLMCIFVDFSIIVSCYELLANLNKAGKHRNSNM